MGTQQILSPVSEARVVDQPIAPRPSTLDGLRIAVLDNQKANAGRLLDGVADALSQRFDGVHLIREHKIATSPAPEPVMDRLRECDAVILAIAD